jgi:hypothetical protein
VGKAPAQPAKAVTGTLNKPPVLPLTGNLKPRPVNPTDSPSDEVK